MRTRSGGSYQQDVISCGDVEDTLFASWFQRANNDARVYPRFKIGCVLSACSTPVPCADVEIQGIPFEFTLAAVDVPGAGNCLYHAVWQAAKLSGILQPFGLRGVDHVFVLRAIVACRVIFLLKHRLIRRGDLPDARVVGDLIAQPNQYLEYSGVVPLVAMAHLLGRTIVTMSCDGVTSVVPGNFVSLMHEADVKDPIVIYHCECCSIDKRVCFGRRNHYAAGVLDDSNKAKLKYFLTVYRRNTVVDLTDIVEDETPAPVGPPQGRSVVSLDGDQQAGKRHTAPKIRPKKRPLPTFSDRRKKSKSGVSDDDVLKSLRERAFTLQELTANELEVLSKSQNYATSPDLALLFFHCCSSDPRTFVHNNETLLGEKSHETVDRLKRSLPKKVSKEQVDESHQRAQARNAVVIKACASCCEIQELRSTDGVGVALKDLPVAFKYTEEEREDLASLPDWIVRDHIQVIAHDGVFFHLNPELVSDIDRVVLCDRCLKDPRESPFSIARGHDYGRSLSLPELNDVAKNCVAPARCFGLDLSLGGKHTTGHSICFPSDGPVQCARVLPSVDPECLPRVTFIGSSDAWRIKKNLYRKLYALPCQAVYEWLRVLQFTHTKFKDEDIEVDDSFERRKKLRELEERIERNVICQDNASAEKFQTDMLSERFGKDVLSTDETEVLLSKVAVLKPTGASQSSQSGSDTIIETMLNMLEPTKTVSPMVIPVQRGSDPVVEWNDNGKLIASAFPCLFMRGGDRLPRGSFTAAFTTHLMRYYDGRFEKDTTLVAMLFNQLQRHTAVKRAAKVGVSHATVLEKFGSLVNSREFREKLISAKEHPNSASSKRLNASLLRVLSLVGGTVPFSPFERAVTRPKIAAMRFRYGVPQHWVTMAPPEHDSLTLLRTAMIREARDWNVSSLYSEATCAFADLPQDLQESARSRLVLSSKYPALSAFAFESRLRCMIEDVFFSRISSDARISHHYGERRCGAYGRVAAHCTVVEAQVDGRLHSHSLVYGSQFTPQLLTRVSCHPELQRVTAEWLDSVSSTSLHEDVHSWREQFSLCNTKLPRAVEIPLPSARDDLESFCMAAQKRVATTNVHSHSAMCYKGRRGKYMCRLARPAGLHTDGTRPFLIRRLKTGDFSHGVRPVLNGVDLDQSRCQNIDDGYDIQNGLLFPRPLDGPVVWELQRPDRDAYTVETNLVLAAVSTSHTNSSVISGEDAGDVVEQYAQAYMTKDKAVLHAAIPTLLTAIDHAAVHPSKADDRDTDSRHGKYLSSRTVNAFTGAQEWSHTVMVFALLGYRSILPSDSFWYISPWAFVKWVSAAHGLECTEAPQESNTEDDSQDCAKDCGNPTEVERQLEDLAVVANNQSHADEFGSAAGGCTRSYRVDDQLVFVSQVDSYLHRGHHFLRYNQLEFECIVDLLPVRQKKEKTTNKGRKPRPGFPLAYTHPLFGHYEAFIRLKMHTPMFAGAPPPHWTDASDSDGKQGTDRRTLARYLLCTFTAWIDGKLEFQFDEDGLLALCKNWDRREASFIHRQRYRHLRNVMRCGYRSSMNESIVTDWRNRNVDMWKDHVADHPQAGLMAAMKT